jgi:hypothetical protein
MVDGDIAICAGLVVSETSVSIHLQGRSLHSIGGSPSDAPAICPETRFKALDSSMVAFLQGLGFRLQENINRRFGDFSC